MLTSSEKGVFLGSSKINWIDSNTTSIKGYKPQCNAMKLLHDNEEL